MICEEDGRSRESQPWFKVNGAAAQGASASVGAGGARDGDRGLSQGTASWGEQAVDHTRASMDRFGDSRECRTEMEMAGKMAGEE